ARSSALNNNASARFVLCDANDTPPTSSWEVLAASATAVAPTASLACAAGSNPGSNAAAGDIRVQERSGQEGSKFAQVAVLPIGATTVTFNSLGRVVNLNAGGSAPLAQINLWPGGNTKMCDPSPLLAANDPRHC